MMSAIEIEDVTKHYQLGATASTASLREAISGTARRLATLPVTSVRRLKSRSAPVRLSEGHFALRDISLRIKSGESVGIIGRNGAGKSTLLKILSRITTPTRGRVRLAGRVGSLLEVGTGFHAELTGRENVYLNGAILGMNRREVSAKFDAIVAFAEVERFLDTPVKRYSSGMYVRLAFAVAAHLEPDVLLIDEVLSVGDLAFQRKCMDHAKRLRERDVTLLFVSHNMFTVRSMCDRGVYLSEGRIVFDGSVEEAASRYDVEAKLDMAGWAHEAIGSDPARCPIRVAEIRMADEAGQPRKIFDHGERLRFQLHFRADEPIHEPCFNVAFTRSDGVICCCHNTSMDQFETGTVRGEGWIELLTPPLKLTSDLYTVQVLIWDKRFQNLYCAQVGQSFHVRDDLLSTEFGVFHEPAEWHWIDGGNDEASQ